VFNGESKVVECGNIECLCEDWHYRIISVSKPVLYSIQKTLIHEEAAENLWYLF